MSKHTPGPWFIWQELAMQREGCDPDEIADTLQYNSQHSIYAGNPKECTRGWLKGHTTHVCDIEADSFDFDDDEDDCRATALANARLIAAAPDLLEFVQEWLGRQGTDENYMTAKARAAIAKATGGE